MYKYILRRLVLLIPVLLGVTLVIFSLMEITDGDPAKSMLGTDASPEAVEALREELGLNKPFLTRYGSYIWNLVTKFDLGTSYSTKQPVSTEIMQRFPTTFLYATLCMIVAICIGIPLGIISATRQYSVFDRIATSVSLLGVSMPTFWFGLILIIAFSVNLQWFPPSGFYGPKYWVLPALTIGVHSSCSIARMTRSSMLEVIRQDYIRTARAKGQAENVIIVKHALKNALIPIVTIIGMQFGANLGGAVVTEQIFSIPGLGKLMIEAVNSRNYPVVQGGVLVIAFSFCMINLLVDILYAYIDPRIKSQFTAKSSRQKTVKGQGGTTT